MSGNNGLKIRFSRGEKAKEVKKLLSKYQIDLSRIQFDTTSKFIIFSGVLLKRNGNDLPAHEMICLVDELMHLGSIQSELENWFISSNTIYFLGGNTDLGYFLADERTAV